MVKTPKLRHSKASREPLTIDLDPTAVSRIEEAGEMPVTNDAAAAEAPDAVREALGETHVEQDEQSAARHEPSGYGFDEAPEQPAAPRQESPVPPPVAARPATGDGFSRIAAGLIGAVAALLLAAGLQYLGLLGSPVASGNGSGVQTEIDGLKQQIAVLQAQPASGDVEAKLTELSSSIQKLKADLTALQQAVAASGTGTNGAGLQALDARVKAVEAAMAKAGQGGSAPAPANLSALAGKLAAAEAATKAASDGVAAANARVAALEQAIASLTGKVDTQADQPKIALAIATAALKSAIERGAPFAAELETLAALAPDATEIATLRPYAEKGVESRASLAEETGAAADAMVAAATPLDPNAGFFDRLLTSAESLVTVRPIGAVEGSSVAAIVARMEVAINAGDLKTALAEFETLPEPVKAAGAAFAEKLKARQAVETLADQAIASAMKA